MTFPKMLALLLIYIFVAVMPDDSHARRKRDSSLAVIVLIENGGTVQNHDATMTTVKNLLGQLTNLKRRRATRNAQISIVLSATPNRIAWSGTPKQLLAQAVEVLKLIKFRSGFNDLVLAFEQIDTTIEIAMPEAYRIYWIGPTIHVPFSASDKEIRVSVPQDIPAGLKLAKVAEKASVLKIYGVHPDQDRKLLDYLNASGISKRAARGLMELNLMGQAQTASHLDDLL